MPGGRDRSVSSRLHAVPIDRVVGVSCYCERYIPGLKVPVVGDYLKIDEILVDCDQDALVYKVTLAGSGVCHTFNKNGKHRLSCFYRKVNIQNKNLSFL